ESLQIRPTNPKTWPAATTWFRRRTCRLYLSTSAETPTGPSFAPTRSGQGIGPKIPSPRRSRKSQNRPKDILALVPVQYLLELASGEGQCYQFISSLRATFRSTSNCATSCVPSYTRAICDLATASRPAAN